MDKTADAVRRSQVLTDMRPAARVTAQLAMDQAVIQVKQSPDPVQIGGALDSLADHHVKLSEMVRYAPDFKGLDQKTKDRLIAEVTTTETSTNHTTVKSQITHIMKSGVFKNMKPQQRGKDKAQFIMSRDSMCSKTDHDVYLAFF